MPFPTSRSILFFLVFFLASAADGADPTPAEPVGERPYELVNAHRDRDEHTPLIDFENLESWVLETNGCEALFRRSRREQLWGEHVGRLTYRKDPNETSGKPVFLKIKPPKPVPVSEPFDCVNLWVYGNNWSWMPATDTPRVHLTLLLLGKEGKSIRIPLDTVRWREWFLVHHRFQPSVLESLGKAPAFEGIEVRGGTNNEFRDLYFDNLSFYREELKPLKFETRPKRPITLPAGQTRGVHTGEGKLPFPTREETILPSSRVVRFTNLLRKSGGAYEFVFKSEATEKEKGSTLIWCYEPKKGTLADWSAVIDGRALQTGEGAALLFESEESDRSAELLSIKQEKDGNDDVVRAVWKYTPAAKEEAGKTSVEATWTFRLWGRSLVVDVAVPGGRLRELRFGIPEASDRMKSTAFALPYLSGNGASRPFVRMFQEKHDKKIAPFFHLAQVDHTRSNGSELFFDTPETADPGKGTGGGVRYKPKTDGRRNACFERLFLTIAPTLDEVLPNIPNPVSPWRQVTGERVWRAHGATDHAKDYAFWKNVHRHGIRKMLVTDHETLWRDGGESFTFRTYAAPKKGGDPGQLDYTRRMHALGFLYGPYNNYTDYAPVNAFWSEDWVTRLPDGNWNPAWARCYNPKPQRAVEAEQKIAEIVQDKFHFNTAYCDVHTAVTPWRYVDYDVRVPGAGIFASTFYAYGEIMLHQKKTWGGPVYSEGNNHWYYCGLTDGNYGQDQAYFVANPDAPWLVDFDLRKMHPRGNDFGMGNLDMFYGKTRPKQDDAALDRFIAATLAFGHTGFFEPGGGMHNAVRSYFLTQAVAERFSTQNVATIRYADREGRLLATEEALANGSYRLNRIEVVYEDGFTLRVNGHRTLSWDALPPHGFQVFDPKNEVVALCADAAGKRFDYVEGPETIYADGRGRLYRYEKILCDGPLVVLKGVDAEGLSSSKAGAPWEVIPIRSGPNPCTVLAVRLPKQQDAEVIALDKDRKELGPVPASYSVSSGSVFIDLAANVDAFSFLLKPKEPVFTARLDVETFVVPGQSVKTPQDECRIPADTKPGTLFRQETPVGWVDFVVLPLGEVTMTYAEADGIFDISIRSHLSKPESFRVFIDGEPFGDSTILMPGKTHRFRGKPPRKGMTPDGLATRKIKLRLETLSTFSGDGAPLSMNKPFWLTTDLVLPDYGAIDGRFETGYHQRRGERKPCGDASGASAYRSKSTCGGQTLDGWAIHPPYVGGVGYTYLLSEPTVVPAGNNVRLTVPVGIRDGGDASDGVLYKLCVIEEDGRETEIASRLQQERSWSMLSGDLGVWSGRKVRILLAADVGPKDNSTADWACTGIMRLGGAEPEKRTTLHEIETLPIFQIPPSGNDKKVPPLFSRLTKPEQQEPVTTATLFFEGCGLSASDQYHSELYVNGLACGRVPAAAGQETKGIWSKVTLSLPPEVLCSLSEPGRSAAQVEIRCSTGDHFKVRDFRLEMTRGAARCTSYLTRRTITHPGTWKHAEGESVSLGAPLAFDLLWKP